MEFNPPFSKNVATNIGRRFRSLVIKHFPRGSRLYKIFNANTLKISYSCMPNMAAISKQHNATIVRKGQPATKNDTVSRKACTATLKISAHWTVHAGHGQSCTRPPSRPITTKGNTSASWRQPSNSGSTPTSSQCATKNTSTARPSRSTSGH